MKCVGGPMHGRDYPLSSGAGLLIIPLFSMRFPKQKRRRPGGWLRVVYKRMRIHSSLRGDYEVLRFVEGYYDQP